MQVNASKPLRLIESVRGAIDQFSLISPSQTVLAAVSGGADSIALLHALSVLRDEFQFKLIAAHLDHGFRGEESEGDAESVRLLCQRLGIDCTLETSDIPARMRRTRESAQIEARTARHAFLKRVANQNGAERIALGHNREDRVETLLLNLFRGTGIEGLAPLRPDEFPLIRPLYDTSRQEIEAYCLQQNLLPRTDSSNKKTTYRRNRIRLELLPLLAQNYNPQINDALLRLSTLANDENEFLEQTTAQIFESVKLPEETSGAALKRSEFLKQPVAIRRRLLRLAVLQARGDRQNLSFETVETVIEKAQIGESAVITLPASSLGTFQIRLTDSALYVEPQRVAATPIPQHILLTIPGRSKYPGSELLIESCIVDSRKELQLRLDAFAVESAAVLSSSPSGFRQAFAFDMANLKAPIALRSWRKGDRMRPHGMEGSKKIHDLFIDRKIPLATRSQIPILADDAGHGAILAVVGVQASATSIRRESSLPDCDSPESSQFLLLFFTQDTSRGFPS